jgi:hypothetical protein
VSLDVSPASPQLFGAVVTLTAAATGCADPEFRFWLITPNPPGVGLVVQMWYSQDTFTWKTVEWAGTGTYGLRVDARHAGATSDTEEATTSQDFVLNPVTTGPACTAVTIEASPQSPQPVGTEPTFTASATGCPSPEFQWWITSNGVGTFQQDWSSSPTFMLWGSWAGTFTVQAKARQAGDTLEEASGQLDYTLTAPPSPPPPTPSPTPPPGPPCTSVAFTVSPQSPQPANTQVTITAAATGCPNPEYNFWATYPDGSPATAWGWTSSNVFVTSQGEAWTTTFTVVARNKGDTTTEATATMSYTFT